MVFAMQPNYPDPPITMAVRLEAMENKRIAIIGAGSMGQAILGGLINSGFDPAMVCASTSTAKNSKALSEKFSVTSLAIEDNSDANSRACLDAEIILLAVKPVKILDTISEIKDSIQRGSLVVSVAAGITTNAIEEIIDDKAAVIRAMPNTPSIVGHGLTGLAKGATASDADLALAKSLFETVGQVLVVDEEMINALSTISGSGPAYVFYFAEKLTKAAIDLGFSEQEADLMVRSTFLGSSMLLATSEKSPEELRAQVTSPNGTTMQATNTFDEHKIEETISLATKAALARAIELGKVKS